LLSIGERAEKIVQAFMEKQQTAQESLKQLEEIISEINRARMEQAEKGMNPAVFTVYWMLHSQGVENPEEVAKPLVKFLKSILIGQRVKKEKNRCAWKCMGCS